MARMSETVLQQKRSGIRKIMELANTLPNVLHMEVGEPLFETPAHIVRAGCEALEHGFTKYAPNAGLYPLREAAVNRLNRELGLSLAVDNVIVGIGGVEVINCAIRALCDAGDEILIPDPSWPNYETMATIASVTRKYYRLLPENSFLPDFNELEGLITDKTKMIIVNSPSNPLGVVMPAETIEKLVVFASKHDIYLLSDEAYEKIVFDAPHVCALPYDTNGRVIAAYTLSKTYAMTGWRVGYAVSDKAVIEQMVKLQEAYVSSVPSAMQMAAVAAICGDQACVEDMRIVYRQHRDLTASILDEYGIDYFMPNGAFYMWINARCSNSTAFAEQLLIKKHVAVAPGDTFGKTGNGYIRISLASSEDTIRSGIRTLAEFIANQGKMN